MSNGNRPEASQGSLVAQSDNSLAPVENESLLRLKGKRALIATAGAAAAAWFSPLLRWGDIVLDWLQRADFLNTKFIELLRWLFSPRGAYYLFGLFLIAFLIAVIRTVNSAQQPKRAVNGLPDNEQDSLNTGHTKADEGLNARVKELEREKITLERGRNEDAVFIRQYKAGVERLSQETADLKSRWDAHIFSNRWLFAKVEAQGQDLSRYVEVEKVYLCYQELETPMLKCVFGIDFRNKSIFDIAIEKKVGEHIKFEGRDLSVSPTIINDPGTVGLGGVGTITLEQQLTRPEADYIASQDPKVAEFNLENLIITIKSQHVTSSEPQHLKIPKRLSSDPQAEVALLKAQLDERARRKEIREMLGLFLERGKRLEKLCENETNSPPESEFEEWDKEAGQWLWDNLGRGYAHRFYSAGELAGVDFLGFTSEEHKRLHKAVHIRVTNLERFIGEIGIG